MSMYPLIKVLQPQAFDLVDDPVKVAGIGTAFEANLNVRVRDANSAELVLTFVTAGGGLGELGNFQVTADLPGTPPTPSGFVEVFDPGGENAPPSNLVVVPVVFGTNLVPGYFGFGLRTVQPGDTLSSISADEYGDANLFQRIFHANRNQIADPNLIFPGQTLRIPKGT
jgi:nucleoid-associated protein YgaU